MPPTPHLKNRLLADPDLMRLPRSVLASRYGCSVGTVNSARNALSQQPAPRPSGSPEPARTGGMDLTVFLSDLHVPYHDRATLDAVFTFIREVRPSHVYLNGDVCDAYQLSRYDKDPNRLLGIQDDLDALDRMLTDLRSAAPDAEIIWTEGNHENRLLRYLNQHPEIANLTALRPENLFGVEKHRLRWIPQAVTHQHHGFVVTHGSVVRRYSSYSAKGQFERYNTSGISGHTHRVGMYRHRSFDSDHVWYEQGCLCELNPTYVIGTPDWHQGFGVGQFLGRRFQVSIVQVVEHRFLWDGQLYG